MQALRKILLPFSWLYGFVVTLRNFLYDAGFFKSVSYPLPIVCVGNLSVGGTGKTPMIEFLISLLKDEVKLAVLSRGYKRRSKGFLLANVNSTVETLGDEPFQYAGKFKNIHVAVDADRKNGIAQLQTLVGPDVILLDDAFQHRKVTAGLNILLTVYNDLYVDDTMLPAGNLRDRKNQAKRAHIVVVTKCPPQLSQEEKERVIKKLKPWPHQKVFFAAIKYPDILCSGQDSITIGSLYDKPFTLVTGIANPKPLLSFLKGRGLKFEHLSFADHHHFSRSEIEVLNQKELILTTEKDYVRLKEGVKNVFYLPIETVILGEEVQFKSLITDYIKKAQ